MNLSLVNDNSPGNSLKKLVSLFRQDGHLKIIDLLSNVGHYKTIIAEFECSIGGCVFLLGGDLEEGPVWLKFFGNELFGSSSSDMAFGFQSKQKKVWFACLSG